MNDPIRDLHKQLRRFFFRTVGNFVRLLVVIAALLYVMYWIGNFANQDRTPKPPTKAVRP